MGTGEGQQTNKDGFVVFMLSFLRLAETSPRSNKRHAAWRASGPVRLLSPPGTWTSCPISLTSPVAGINPLPQVPQRSKEQDNRLNGITSSLGSSSALSHLGSQETGTRGEGENRDRQTDRRERRRLPKTERREICQFMIELLSTPLLPRDFPLQSAKKSEDKIPTIDGVKSSVIFNRIIISLLSVSPT